MGIGTPELIIVMVIALLLFGKDLPRVAKSMGKTVAQFKKGMQGFTSEIHSATQDIEDEVSSVKKTVSDSVDDVKKQVDLTSSEETSNTPTEKKSTPKFVEDDEEEN